MKKSPRPSKIQSKLIVRDALDEDSIREEMKAAGLL